MVSTGRSSPQGPVRRRSHPLGCCRLRRLSRWLHSAMQSVQKVLMVVAVLGAGAGVGSALFALVTPGELQKQEMLKEMPEQDPRRRDEGKRNQQLVMATLQEAAATQENVAWRKNWLVGGGGRSA
ncbi:ubiquinol-cytochrome-c reductase complex assembly factor 3 [Ictidomys tridecemlineatus]|nr:ubiquinol-cytochrome-c reductase complex assembly factor 3 [Ictidomys tridecemlineatus]